MERTEIDLPVSPVHGPLRYERVWADAVGPGRFRLLASLFSSPLAAGDVVATQERNGRHVILSLADPGDVVLSAVMVDGSVSPADVLAVTTGWRAAGALRTDRCGRVLLAAWDTSLGPSDVTDLLAAALADRPGWHSPVVYAPEDRLLQMEGVLSA